MKILCDLDSIIVNFMDGLWDAMEAVTGERGDTARVTEWDVGKFVFDRDMVYGVMFSEGFFRGLKPLPGAIESVKRLKEAGHDVYIASTPCTSHSASEKLEWCKKHLPFIPQKDIFICHRKDMIKADILIDDSLANATAFRSANKDALILTIGYPYNEDPDCAYDHRVEDGWKDTEEAWSDILGFLKSAVDTRVEREARLRRLISESQDRLTHLLDRPLYEKKSILNSTLYVLRTLFG